MWWERQTQHGVGGLVGCWAVGDLARRAVLALDGKQCFWDINSATGEGGELECTYAGMRFVFEV